MRDLALLALASSVACLVAAGRLLARAHLVPSMALRHPRLARHARHARYHRPTAGLGASALGRWSGRWLEAHLPRSVLAPMRRRLVAGGASGGAALTAHLAHRARLVAAAGVLGLVVLSTGSPSVLVLGPLGAWLAADGSLDAAARRRCRRIEAQLPDYLDVVAVVLTAGLGFTEALDRVAHAMPGPIAEEVRHALQQIDVGVRRRDAFLELRGRTASTSLDGFVTTLLQAEELGAPLADAVVALASDVRRGAAQAARRRAARSAPRISLVLTTVVVPAALVLLLAGLFLGSGVDLGATFGS